MRIADTTNSTESVVIANAGPVAADVPATGAAVADTAVTEIAETNPATAVAGTIADDATTNDTLVDDDATAPIHTHQGMVDCYKSQTDTGFTVITDVLLPNAERPAQFPHTALLTPHLSENTVVAGGALLSNKSNDVDVFTTEHVVTATETHIEVTHPVFDALIEYGLIPTTLSNIPMQIVLADGTKTPVVVPEIADRKTDEYQTIISNGLEGVITFTYNNGYRYDIDIQIILVNPDIISLIEYINAFDLKFCSVYTTGDDVLQFASPEAQHAFNTRTCVLAVATLSEHRRKRVNKYIAHGFTVVVVMGSHVIRKTFERVNARFNLAAPVIDLAGGLTDDDDDSDDSDVLVL